MSKLVDLFDREQAEGLWEIMRTSRRHFLAGGAAALAASRLEAQPAHARFGPVRPPLPVPAIKVVRQDGRPSTLVDILAHHLTAVQLIFTSCRATCPIQGATFSRAQKLILGPASHGIQLLTLSVDPQHDDPEALASWLKTHQATSIWTAAVPAIESLERMRAFFGPGSTADDNHSTQVSVINRNAQLVWRTPALPSAEDVANLLETADF